MAVAGVKEAISYQLSAVSKEKAVKVKLRQDCFIRFIWWAVPTPRDYDDFQQFLSFAES
jgi:hypothetical protein